MDAFFVAPNHSKRKKKLEKKGARLIKNWLAAKFRGNIQNGGILILNFTTFQDNFRTISILEVGI